jgi:hypothetical protein
LLAARRANGDFDRDNSDNADNLSTLSSTGEVDLTQAGGRHEGRDIRGGGAAGGGANGEQLGLEGMAQDLGLDPAIFAPRPTAAVDAEDDDDDDEDFEEGEEMQESDDDDVLLDQSTGSEEVDDY